MKPEYKLFGILAVFFFLVGTIYGLVTQWDEPVGFVGLYLSGGLGVMIAFYLAKTAAKLPLRPEDDLDGEIEQQAGSYGSFAPYSWWPLWLALSGSIIFLGAAVGIWVAVLGAVFGVFALVGWVFEYYKGEHAH